MSAFTIVAVVAVLIYIIARQLLGEPIRSRRLIILPGVLTIIGAADLAKHTVHPTSTDILLIAVGAAIAAVTGVAQGRAMRLQKRDGSLWGQLPLQDLWLWALLYASRGGLIGAAHATGAHVAAGAQSELLILGINRLAQAAIVATRALAAGIPLAPAKDRKQPSPALSTRQRAAAPPSPDQTAAGEPATPPAAEHAPAPGTAGTRWANLARQAAEAASDAASSRRQNRHPGRTARREARTRRRPR